jgi:Uma2 family endonuclease
MAVATLPQAEQLVVLDHVSWETYERLLAENDPGRGKRFAYDNGRLQIMVLSYRHEHPNRLLASIVEILADEWELNVSSSGSVTVKRSDLFKGFEPDSSFYIRNARAVRGKEELNFAIDPPPDLVIEIDITRDSLNKFPIFAAVGVPEVWRYHQSRVAIHLLREGAYVEAPVSEMLPPVTGDLLTTFLQAGLDEERPQWVRRLREWAHSARR